MRNWIIKKLGGYTFDEYLTDIKQETRATKIDCYQNELVRWIYIVDMGRNSRRTHNICKVKLISARHRLMKLEQGK